ncbi:uncharacterized protein EV154DRAFT_395674, partial [Mucor mucedo]|uniref:uncharacterized protein n=1 Tax=Mucor mucedo TaxID=29922 RepID=UPI0022211553
LEEQEKQAKILNSYNKWCKIKEAANYWKQRDQANNGEANDDDVVSTPKPSPTSSDTLETTETVESAPLDEAKKMISKGLQINDGHRDHCNRKSIYNSLKFKGTDHKFLANIMMVLISIVNGQNCGTSRIDTVTKVLTLTSNITDPMVTQLLSYVNSMVETLPFDNQTEKIKEFELCTRYLQPLFPPLFDSGDDNIIFKRTNTNGLDDNLIKSRPDGCIKMFQKSIVFIEVKPMDKAKNHREINVDLHRLRIFSKEATTQYKLKHTFVVMAIG